jgi:isoamylase
MTGFDAVVDQTAEGDERGPMLCFPGLDKSECSMLEEDLSRYANYRGRGNPLKANHPVAPA